MRIRCMSGALSGGKCGLMMRIFFKLTKRRWKRGELVFEEKFLCRAKERKKTGRQRRLQAGRRGFELGYIGGQRPLFLRFPARKGNAPDGTAGEQQSRETARIPLRPNGIFPHSRIERCENQGALDKFENGFVLGTAVATARQQDFRWLHPSEDFGNPQRQGLRIGGIEL